MVSATDQYQLFYRFSVDGPLSHGDEGFLLTPSSPKKLVHGATDGVYYGFGNLPSQGVAMIRRSVLSALLLLTSFAVSQTASPAPSATLVNAGRLLDVRTGKYLTNRAS